MDGAGLERGGVAWEGRDVAAGGFFGTGIRDVGLEVEMEVEMEMED